MNMKSEKRSLALLSNKRTKAYTRTIADETFSLPSFSDTIPSFTIDTPHKSSKMLWSMHLEHDRNIEKLKQKMLEHELVFKEQLFELHRLYNTQQLMMSELKTRNPTQCSVPSCNAAPLCNSGSLKRKGDHMLWDGNDGNSSRKTSFSPSEYDMNKSREVKRRPEIDLEQPAAEDMDFEIEKEPHGLLQKCKVDALYEDMPFGKFPLNSPDLNHAVRENAHDMYSGIIHSDEKRKFGEKLQKQASGEIQFFNVEDSPQRSREATSKLPHWLLQSSPITSSTAKSGSQASSGKQHPLPLFMQKHEERKLFGERILSSREVSSPYSSTFPMNSQQGERPSKESFPRHILNEIATTAHDIPSNVENDRSFLSRSQNNRNITEESIPFFSNGREREIYFHTPVMCTLSSHPPSSSSSSSPPPPPPLIVGFQTPFNVKAPTTNVISHMAFPGHKAGGVANSSIMALVYQQNLFPSVTMEQASMPILGFNQNSFHQSDINFLATQNHKLEMPGSHDVKGRYGQLEEEGNDCDSRYKIPATVRPEMPSNKAFLGSTCNGSNTAPKLCHGNSKRGDPKEIRHNLDLNVQICEDLVENDSSTETVITTIRKESIQEPAVLIAPQWTSRHGSHDPHRPLQSSSYMKSNAFLDESGREHVSSESVSAKSTMEEEGNNDIRRNRNICGRKDRCEEGSVAVKSCSGLVLTRLEARETITTASLSSLKVQGDSNGSSEGGWQCHRNDEIAFSSIVWPEKTALADVSTDYITSNFLATTKSTVSSLAGRSIWNDGGIAADILLSFGIDWHKASVDDDDDYNDNKQGRSLKQLADAIPEVENDERLGGIVDIGDGDDWMAVMLDEVLVRNHEKALDYFELAILRLEPISPDIEKLCVNVMDDGNSVREESPPPLPPQPNVRRRSPRRGKAACKDFQKDVLSSIVSLSRQEITEDLQIIEGLIESTMTLESSSPKVVEVEEQEQEQDVGRCFTIEQVPAPPKQTSKTKTAKLCKNKKSTLILRFCTWGEATRGKRMRRRRSHCPPVIKSLLS